MSGIYLHIPFCKQACYYCDFHFSTNQSRKAEMVKAIGKELELQTAYLGGETVETIYFGGGTPSLLSVSELSFLLEKIHALFSIELDLEITLEANPDDFSKEKVDEWKSTGVNRLSIGIQTFHNPHLQRLNRAHKAEEALTAVKLAQDVGLANLSIDLIYAIPHSDHSIWENDLQQALALNAPHISSYCLTVEERTVLGNWVKKGRFQEASENFAAEQFELLTNSLRQAGYEHYEISNFAFAEKYSRHNTSYWQQKAYLGVGPGAHSYNRISRQYNLKNNAHYLKALSNDQLSFEQEELSKIDRINEFVMTRLRTQWGCDLALLQKEEQIDLRKEKGKELDRLTASGLLAWKGDILFLTEQGKLLADYVTGELFLD